MSIGADGVRFLWTGTGTGSVVAGSAAPGYNLPPANDNGKTLKYRIQHATAAEGETGEGLWTHASQTLTRLRVIKSTNNDNAVAFSAGNKFVSWVATSEEYFSATVASVDPSVLNFSYPGLVFNTITVSAAKTFSLGGGPHVNGGQISGHITLSSSPTLTWASQFVDADTGLNSTLPSRLPNGTYWFEAEYTVDAGANVKVLTRIAQDGVQLGTFTPGAISFARRKARYAYTLSSNQSFDFVLTGAIHGAEVLLTLTVAEDTSGNPGFGFAITWDANAKGSLLDPTTIAATTVVELAMYYDALDGKVLVIHDLLRAADMEVDTSGFTTINPPTDDLQTILDALDAAVGAGGGAGSGVLVDLYGADPTGVIDSTSGIQAAIDTSASVLVFSGSYKIQSPVNLRNNQVLLINNSTLFRSGEDATHYLLSGDGITTYIIGPGTIDGGRSATTSYNPNGQGSIINLDNCQGLVSGLKLTNAMSDGIRSACYSPATLDATLTIRNIETQFCRRSGVAIVGIGRVLLENIRAFDTFGTQTDALLRGAGIDIEPNDGSVSGGHVSVRNCFIGSRTTNATLRAACGVQHFDISSAVETFTYDIDGLTVNDYWAAGMDNTVARQMYLFDMQATGADIRGSMRNIVLRSNATSTASTSIHARFRGSADISGLLVENYASGDASGQTFAVGYGIHTGDCVDIKIKGRIKGRFARGCNLSWQSVGITRPKIDLVVDVTAATACAVAFRLEDTAGADITGAIHGAPADAFWFVGACASVVIHDFDAGGSVNDIEFFGTSHSYVVVSSFFNTARSAAVRTQGTVPATFLEQSVNSTTVFGASLAQYELAGRLAAGTGPLVGLDVADFTENTGPTTGHKLLGFLSGSGHAALRTFDVGNLPSATGSFNQTTAYGGGRTNETNRSASARLTEGARVNVADFATVDDAIIYANSLRTAGAFPTLWFSPYHASPYGYTITAVLTDLKAGISVIMDAPIRYIDNNLKYAGAVWTIGESGAQNDRVHIELWNAVFSASNTGSEPEYTAFRLMNISNSLIRVRRISGANIALQFRATAGHYCAWNDIFAGNLVNPVIGLDMLADGAGAWITVSNVYGGIVGGDGALSAGRRGFRQRGQNSFLALNTCFFVGTDVEMSGDDSYPFEFGDGCGLNSIHAHYVENVTGGLAMLHGTAPLRNHFEVRRFTSAISSGAFQHTGLFINEPEVVSDANWSESTVSLTGDACPQSVPLSASKSFNHSARGYLNGDHIIRYTGSGGHTLTMDKCGASGQFIVSNEGTGVLTIAAGTMANTYGGPATLAPGEKSRVVVTAKGTVYEVISLSGAVKYNASVSGTLGPLHLNGYNVTSGAVTVPNTTAGWACELEFGANTHDITFNSLTLDISAAGIAAGDVATIRVLSSSVIRVITKAGTFTQANFA